MGSGQKSVPLPLGDCTLSLPAFTNLVGGYARSEYRQNSVEVWFGDSHTISYDYPYVFVEGSAKSPTIGSDRHFPTEYSRRVVKVLDDSPALLDRQWSADGVPVRRIDRWFLSSLVPGYALPTPLGWSSWMANAYSRSITEARNRLRSGRVQNGADLAQARQMYNMISADSLRLMNVFNAFKNGGLISAIRLLKQRGLGTEVKDLSAFYLEFIYGWKPLMQSIYDNVQLLKTGIPTTGATLSSSCNSNVSMGNPFTSGSLDGNVHSTGNCRVVYHAAVSDGVIHLIDTLGFINPAEVAWELTPYSFVLDWFVPFGSFFGSLSATAGLRFSNGYSSMRQTHDWFLRDTFSGSGSYKVREFSFSRSPLYGFELPELYAKDNPFSTQHGLNAAAMAAQLIRW